MAQELATLEAPARGKHVTMHELAEFLGMSYDAVRKDVMAGSPTVFDGEQGKSSTILNTYDWYHWKMSRIRAEKRSSYSNGSTSGDAKDRALEATAAKREAEVAKMRGELVPLASIVPLIEDGFINFRTKLDALEERLTAEYGPELAKEIQEFVLNAVNSVVDSVVEEAENLER